MLTAARREEVERMVHAMSRKGERVIAAAVIPAFKGELADSGTTPIERAMFVGLFGMRDTLREGVREAVQSARDRGLKVVMITGDHKVTAEAIAREAGIFVEGDMVLSEKELRELSDSELKAHLGKTSVFARIAPEEKLKLIQLYREQGEIVAMTGDGVNDALSLVAADLGIAMGKIGTEVSKEAADIVLLDDNFKSIVDAVDEGRNMYKGIKKVLLYLFSTGFGELFTVLFALVLSFPLPLFPTQILWLNLVTDGFLVFALGLESTDVSLGKEHVSRVRRTRSFFDRAALVRMFLMALVMSAGSILLFALVYKDDFVKASTFALTALAVFQWFNAWNVRSEKASVYGHGFFSNMYLVFSTGIVILLQLGALYLPFMQKILHTTALSFLDLVAVVVVATSILLVEEGRKWVVRTFPTFPRFPHLPTLPTKKLWHFFPAKKQQS